MATTIKTPITKSAIEVVKQSFDFTEFDGAGTIEGYAVSSSQSGLVLVRSVLANGFLTLVLAAGVPDHSFIVGVRAIRSDGLISEQRVTVNITGPSLIDFSTDGLISTFPDGALMLGTDAIFFNSDNLVIT